jgi:hypothetical protein
MSMGFGFAFIVLAWTSFSLAMPKHQRAVLARMLPAHATPWLQLTAWCLLAAGLAACIATKGASQGPIFWGALLMLTAFAWVLLMTFAPRRSVAVAVMAALLGSAFALV